MGLIPKKVLRGIDNMPSLPITVAKVLEVAKNENVSPIELNKVISLDPVLTAKVLKLINSAYYAVGNEITSIVKAIIMLGLNTIKNLALSTAIIPIVETSSQSGKKQHNISALNIEAFWKHCIATGVASKLIAKHLNIDPKQVDEYFIAGLLHDIGKIIFNNSIPEDYLEIIKEADMKKVPFYQMENQIMGSNHTEVGGVLSEKWKLSPEIYEVITLHHDPKQASEKNRKLVYAVSVANIFCNQNQIGFSGDITSLSFDEEVLKYLNLTIEKLYDWEKTIGEEIKKASIFMKLTS